MHHVNAQGVDDERMLNVRSYYYCHLLLIQLSLSFFLIFYNYILLRGLLPFLPFAGFIILTLDKETHT